MTDVNEGGWYWCMRHQAVEPADRGCPPDQRTGPYATEEEARHWRDKVEARNEAWEEEDRRWEGEEE